MAWFRSYKTAMHAWEERAFLAEAKMGRYYQALKAADKGLHRQARKIHRLRSMLLAHNINPDSNGHPREDYLS